MNFKSQNNEIMNIGLKKIHTTLSSHYDIFKDLHKVEKVLQCQKKLKYFEPSI
jgi:hypothetical protein